MEQWIKRWSVSTIRGAVTQFKSLTMLIKATTLTPDCTAPIDTANTSSKCADRRRYCTCKMCGEKT